MVNSFRRGKERNYLPFYTWVKQFNVQGFRLKGHKRFGYGQFNDISEHHAKVLILNHISKIR
jgi:hypothetical protein